MFDIVALARILGATPVRSYLPPVTSSLVEIPVSVGMSAPTETAIPKTVCPHSTSCPVIQSGVSQHTNIMCLKCDVVLVVAAEGDADGVDVFLVLELDVYRQGYQWTSSVTILDIEEMR